MPGPASPSVRNGAESRQFGYVIALLKGEYLLAFAMVSGLLVQSLHSALSLERV